MNRSSPPQPLRRLLNGSSHLRQLLEHAGYLHGVERRLRPLWPAPLNAHLRVLNVQGHTLILQADSAAWATQGRCLIPAMLDALNGDAPANAQLRTIRIKVAPG